MRLILLIWTVTNSYNYNKNEQKAINATGANPGNQFKEKST